MDRERGVFDGQCPVAPETHDVSQPTQSTDPPQSPKITRPSRPIKKREMGMAEGRKAHTQKQASASWSPRDTQVAPKRAERSTLSYQRPSMAMPPRSAIGSGTTRTSIAPKCISVRSTATELAKARYQPRNTCDG